MHHENILQKIPGYFNDLVINFACHLYLTGIKEKTSLVRLGLKALFRKIYFSVDFLAFLYYIKILNSSGKFIFREKNEFPDRPPGQ
jgi:hypothetical protein